MLFRYVFTSVVIATALLAAAFMLHRARPSVEVDQPSVQLARAAGKCAQCHREESPAMVHEFELSRHAATGINCLDCHQPAEGQESVEHHGFTISASMSAANCRSCHEREYQQYLRSRHAAPAWAAVKGPSDFTQEQIAHAEQYHPGAVNRPANALALLEGEAAIVKGCASCHDIGKPNPDGSLGMCTACHSRHAASVELARLPRTCGQCHMGPDHSQIEIYEESKHGVLFASQRDLMNMRKPPQELTTADMWVPTCTTCHMSGLDGMNVTHDPGERLSYWLFAEVSDQRPHYIMAQANMKDLCMRCHTKPSIDRFYLEAEAVVDATNEKVKAAKAVMDELYAEGLLTKAPFDEPVEFLYFDLWHYFGRTAKHGAFMGGADFVQWHGNYELLLKMVELKQAAKELRERAAQREQASTPDHGEEGGMPGG
jgi:hypothetical protein